MFPGADVQSLRAEVWVIRHEHLHIYQATTCYFLKLLYHLTPTTLLLWFCPFGEYKVVHGGFTCYFPDY